MRLREIWGRTIKSEEEEDLEAEEELLQCEQREIITLPSGVGGREEQ